MRFPFGSRYLHDLSPKCSNRQGKSLHQLGEVFGRVCGLAADRLHQIARQNHIRLDPHLAPGLFTPGAQSIQPAQVRLLGRGDVAGRMERAAAASSFNRLQQPGAVAVDRPG